ncbi:hypothetical protein Aph02nite_15610 [Actinoplanes philippinensis]|nr:hypothetical protein Aph02nite_15610 [Actinoplanes philippinensis]
MRGAAAFGEDDDAQPVVADGGESGGGVVVGTVDHDDHLEVAMRLRERAADGANGQVRAVARGDDDADVRVCRHESARLGRGATRGGRGRA